MQLLLLLSLWNPAVVPVTLDTIPKKIFKTTIVNQAAQQQSGYFYIITDSVISLTDAPVAHRVLSPSNTIRNYSYGDIDYIKMKRKGSAGRGALYGALAGAGAGALGGAASGNDDPNTWFAMTAGEKAAVLGVFFAVTGALVGLLIGAVSHKKFQIGGSREKFQQMETTVLEKLYGNKNE